MRTSFTLAIGLVVILLCACSSETNEPPVGETATSAGEAAEAESPIDPATVQEHVEQHESFAELKQAAVPRRVPDRGEERRRYPAIDILKGLDYITISDDSSRGAYEKVIELSGTGRMELLNEFEEEEDRYVIDVAQRAYVAGSERFDSPHGKEDEVLTVSFRWKWDPLNELGKRLNLRANDSRDDLHQGRATYVRSGDDWVLEKVWLDSSGRDYVRGF